MKNNISFFKLIFGFVFLLSCDGFDRNNSDSLLVEIMSRVSVSSIGQEGNAASYGPSISGDGRFVCFESYASNLVTGDTNSFRDVFVHDRLTGLTRRVSIGLGGAEGNGDSTNASISADGRYISFTSLASNLVVGDTNSNYDVFVYDLITGQTKRVSLSSDGVEGNSISAFPRISHDGRYISFESVASNLVTGDTNGVRDVFIYDQATTEVTRISVSSSGIEGNLNSYQSDLSDDGRYIVFRSDATNLVEDDTNSDGDIFIHDRQTGNTTRVSVSSAGAQGNRTSFVPKISGDGRYIGYSSLATNLVSNDLNNSADIFVYDRQNSVTTRVSVGLNGVEGNGNSANVSFSRDGRFIGFSSNSTNFVINDNNNSSDIFVFDQVTGIIMRISENINGVEADQDSILPQISRDGYHISFASNATNLVNNDVNGFTDIFTVKFQ